MDKEERRLLDEALKRQASRPSHEIWEDMVRRGAIDREGNVLLRAPSGPGFGEGEIHDRDKPTEPEGKP